MNEWLKGRMYDAFHVYKIMHAMRLHFKTPYSYPKYNGGTNMKFENFLKNPYHKRDMLKFNRFKSEHEPHMEKFIFVCMASGLIDIDQLLTREAGKIWHEFNTKLSNRALFQCTMPSISDRCFETLLYKTTDSSRLMQLSVGAYLIHHDPTLLRYKDENIIISLEIDEMLKVKEFLDWYCLL